MAWRLNTVLKRLRAGVWSCQPWLLPLGYLTTIITMTLLLRGENHLWSPLALTDLGGSPEWTMVVAPSAARVISPVNQNGSGGVDTSARLATLPRPTPGGNELSYLPINLMMVQVLREAKFRSVGAIGAGALSAATRLPERLARLEGEDRKKIFIGAVLPTVMVAVNEVKQEREKLLAILAELGDKAEEISFAEDQAAWQDRLGADKSQFILSLVRKYRTTSASELVAMVNVLPPSLILAQGAIESSWGGSRYAVEANNLFGMYASVGGGQAKSGDAGPRIMEYDSILESVRAYVLNINRLPAYRELRRIRSRTLDPMLIAEGLSRYSERKEYYIKDIKHIIVLNRLQDYDALIHVAG